MNKCFKLIGVVSILFLSYSASAQMMKDSIQEVVVTDSKIERPIRQTARPFEVISQDVVQQYIGKSLDQLLEDQVGISINGGNSNPAAIKNIYVRGAAPGYTLILIDGLPATDASSIGSTVDFRLFDINQVERIEVAKGSQSTLYGSDAIAGVINIITKNSDDNAYNVNLNYGSYNTVETGVGIDGKLGQLKYNVGFQYADSEGISEAFDESGDNEFDKDGLNKTVIYGKLNMPIGEKWSIEPTFQVSAFEGGYDSGSFVDGTDTYESELTNLGAKINFDNGALKFNAAYNNIQAERTFFTQFGDFVFDGNTQNIDAYLTYKTGNISIIGGIHNQHAKIVDAGTTEVDPSWNIISPYANFIYLKDDFQVEAGLRYNSHSNFGGNLNYAITPSLFLSNNFKIYTSYSTAFKAPALYELYGAFGANPDLDPQTSATFEAGSQLYFDNGSVSLTYFDRSVKDVILYTSMYENFAEQNDQGVEIAARFTISDKFNYALSYVYVDGHTINDSDVKTANLYKRPKHQVGFNLGYVPSEQWNIRLVNQWYSDRTDLFFNALNFSSSVVEMNAYLRTDLSISYQINKDIRLFSHINNLWDNEYFETYGFTTQGINFRVGGTLRL